MRPLLFGVVACALGACALPGAPVPPDASPPPAPIGGAVVDPLKVVISPPVDGGVSVAGKPGCVYGAVATTVTLTIVREVAPPAAAAWHLQHVGGGLPIASGFASVSADGSFAETRLGEASRPVRSGDELNVTPQQGTTQAGPSVALQVP